MPANLVLRMTTTGDWKKFESANVFSHGKPPKWEVLLDDRYFHSAFMYVSFNMPFFVVLCHFCFTISPDSNKRFPLFKF